MSDETTALNPTGRVDGETLFVDTIHNEDGSTEKGVLLTWKDGAWRRDEEFSPTSRDVRLAATVSSYVFSQVEEALTISKVYHDYRVENVERKLNWLWIFTTALVLGSTAISVYMR